MGRSSEGHEELEVDEDSTWPTLTEQLNLKEALKDGGDGGHGAGMVVPPGGWGSWCPRSSIKLWFMVDRIMTYHDISTVDGVRNQLTTGRHHLVQGCSCDVNGI